MCHMAAMACRGVLPRGRWPQPPRYSERPAATGLPCRPRPSSPMPPDRRRKQHKTRHDDNDDDRCCAWRRTRANGWPRAIESSDSSAAVPLGFKMHSHFKTLHVLPHPSLQRRGRRKAKGRHGRFRTSSLHETGSSPHPARAGDCRGVERLKSSRGLKTKVLANPGAI